MFLSYRHTDDCVFDDFSKISEDFPKIFEDFPKLFRRPLSRGVPVQLEQTVLLYSVEGLIKRNTGKGIIGETIKRALKFNLFRL